MEHFLIEKVNTDGYNRYVICLTSESIFDYLSQIESSKEMATYSGKVLIDNLLVTGNADNRFISCSFHDGKLDKTTAKIVNPNNIFRVITNEKLQRYYNYVECSILTEHQKQCIRNGLVF